jgi:hypothetical protein
MKIGHSAGALVLAVAISACSAQSAAPSAPSAVATSVFSPTASVRPSGWPDGDAVPTELAGKWYGAADTLSLSGYTYSLLATGASGNVVVSGNQIAFFNGTGCGALLPAGIGRYSWAVSGQSVTFREISDVCGRMRYPTWTRTKP